MELCKVICALYAKRRLVHGACRDPRCPDIKFEKDFHSSQHPRLTTLMGTMPCSACTSRSLGAFVLDFTGLNVKNAEHIRRAVNSTSSIRKPFTTQPPLRLRPSHQAKTGSVIATHRPSNDDLYVPFGNSGDSVGTSSARKRDTTPLPFDHGHPQPAASQREYKSAESSQPQDSVNQILADSKPYNQAVADADVEPSSVVSQKSAGHTDKAIDREPAVLELSASSIEALSAQVQKKKQKKKRLYPSTSEASSEGYAPPHPQNRSPIHVAERSFTRTSLGKTNSRQGNSGIAVEADNWTPPKREQWQIQKASLSDKFKDEAWNPRKRLSPDALEGIRALNAQYPEKYTTPVLAAKFEVSPEVIRRILKSKWRPSDEETEDRKRRWDKRGEKIWGQMVELGVKPPKKWREMGIGRAEDDEPRRRKRSAVNGHASSGKGDRSWLAQSTPSGGQGHEGATSEYEPLGERIL